MLTKCQPNVLSLLSKASETLNNYNFSHETKNGHFNNIESTMIWWDLPSAKTKQHPALFCGECFFLSFSKGVILLCIWIASPERIILFIQFWAVSLSTHTNLHPVSICLNYQFVYASSCNVMQSWIMKYSIF